MGNGTTVPTTGASGGGLPIPDAQSVLDWINGLSRLAVMLGPVLILGFGLLFLLAPPKEANYRVGYRSWWGMASLESWQFTQRLAGMVWSGLGLVLVIVMGILTGNLGDLDWTAMLTKTMICIAWQIGALVVACIAIEIVLICLFDRRGFRRKDYR